MTRPRILLFLLAAPLLGCLPPGQGPPDGAPAGETARQEAAARPAPAADDDVVTVVCETKYYVVGIPGHGDLQLLTEADPKRMWDVSGFVLEVVRPPEHAGRIITMHHDGV